MRLLHQGDEGQISLTESLADDSIPPYAILSHMWESGSDEEVTYRDLVTGAGQDKAGYRKIEFCKEQAKQNGLQYFWVDTCCIDRSDNDELAHAISSMFAWYRRASRCYIYFSNIPNSVADQLDLNRFRNMRWFSRGWTIQELLPAPRPNLESHLPLHATRKHAAREKSSAEMLGMLGINKKRSYSCDVEICGFSGGLKGADTVTMLLTLLAATKAGNCGHETFSMLAKEGGDLTACATMPSAIWNPADFFSLITTSRFKGQLLTRQDGPKALEMYSDTLGNAPDIDAGDGLLSYFNDVSVPKAGYVELIITATNLADALITLKGHEMGSSLMWIMTRTCNKALTSSDQALELRYACCAGSLDGDNGFSNAGLPARLACRGKKRTGYQFASKLFWGLGASVCALGETSYVRKHHLLPWTESPIGTDLGATLLHLAGFTVSTTCLYRSFPKNSYQDGCLILGVLSGVAVGILTEETLQDTILKILPGTVLLSFFLNGLVDMITCRHNIYKHKIVCMLKPRVLDGEKIVGNESSSASDHHVMADKGIRQVRRSMWTAQR